MVLELCNDIAELDEIVAGALLDNSNELLAASPGWPVHAQQKIMQPIESSEFFIVINF